MQCSFFRSSASRILLKSVKIVKYLKVCKTWSDSGWMLPVRTTIEGQYERNTNWPRGTQQKGTYTYVHIPTPLPIHRPIGLGIPIHLYLYLYFDLILAVPVPILYLFRDNSSWAILRVPCVCSYKAISCIPCLKPPSRRFHDHFCSHSSDDFNPTYSILFPWC